MSLRKRVWSGMLGERGENSSFSPRKFPHRGTVRKMGYTKRQVIVIINTKKEGHDVDFTNGQGRCKSGPLTKRNVTSSIGVGRQSQRNL